MIIPNIYVYDRDVLDGYFNKLVFWILSNIDNKRCVKKTYVFIDEYAEIKWSKEVNKGIRNLIFNRHELNIELVVASQIKDTFCTRLKASVDAVITLNSHPRNK